VYLPLGYLYAIKAACPVTPLICELREEIYDQPYEQIDFRAYRATVAPCDNYVRPARLLHAANQVLHLYERRPIRRFRESALSRVLDHLDYEDRTTNLINIGPVNAVLNTIVHYCRDPHSAAFREHFAALDVYLAESADGLLMNGQNTTALWDTALAVQAIVATPFMNECAAALARAHEFIRHAQIVDDLPEADRYFRHPSRGGWPFGNRAQGWPVSDCTAEGFRSAVALASIVDDPLPEDRLCDSIRWLLSLQNRDGGWASYEKRRGGTWLEWLNPSHVFADIMVDYSYTECTSACVQALSVARDHLNGRFGAKLNGPIRRGAQLIRRNQRKDGSWEGSWGVCFTCGAWYGVRGLRAASFAPDSPEVCRAADFLLRHQNPDGGWGESYRSCIERRYVRAEPSRAVNTAWALMALVDAGRADCRAAARAARYLHDTQLGCGDWPYEPMTGVFNKTVLIHYENYRRYFPVRALAEYWRAVTARGSTGASVHQWPVSTVAAAGAWPHRSRAPGSHMKARQIRLSASPLCRFPVRGPAFPPAGWRQDWR